MEGEYLTYEQISIEVLMIKLGRLHQEINFKPRKRIIKDGAIIL